MVAPPTHIWSITFMHTFLDNGRAANLMHIEREAVDMKKTPESCSVWK